MFEIRNYLTEAGHDVVSRWFASLRDSRAKVAIDRRLNRVELGNFGDCKPCRDGVWELRIDVGPGYRVYYALAGQRVVLLLCGGDKRIQEADIRTACDYWRDPMRDRPRDEVVAESFRKDPAYALELLNATLEDGALDEAMIVLRQMSKAFGGMGKVAEAAQLNSNSMYRTLSAQGNPQVSTLSAILRTMGLRLAVQPIQQAA